MADSVDGHAASQCWDLSVSLEERPERQERLNPLTHPPPALVARFQSKNIQT